MSGARPSVSVIVVSYNTAGDLARCLRSLAEHAALTVETVVVDNASDDGTPRRVRDEFPAVELIANERNLGFASACNQALRATGAPFALFLNSDAELRPGALPHLVSVLEQREDAAAVGPRTLNSDGTIQLSWGPALTPLSEWRQRRRVRALRARRPGALRAVDIESRRAHEPDWISGACLLARRAALDQVGGFDEGYFLYEEDVDLCLRWRRAGWRVLYSPGAEVVHHLGRSTARAAPRSALEYQRSHLRYYRQHLGPARTALLRLWLLASGAGTWLSGLGRGDRAGHGRSLCALAVTGERRLP